jgi:hypothetical protein
MTNTAQADLHTFAQAMTLVAKRNSESMKICIQEDGTLRIVCANVSLARITMSRTERATGVNLKDLVDTFQLRFWGTDLVATYQVVFDASNPSVQSSTGMLIDQSSPELVCPANHRCQECGQVPLHHRRGCSNKRH